MAQRIILATDHRGYWLKEHIKTHDNIGGVDVAWYDVGARTPERSDYTEYAIHGCNQLLSGDADSGIFICGTGTGMAIAANRYRYVYAGVAWTPEIARHGKEDDHMNVLALPADWVDHQQALEIISEWLQAHFKGGRYAQRLAMLDGV